MTNNDATIKYRDRIILAGAGFSASVGGFLATEMWERLFLSEYLEAHDDLKQAIKDPKFAFDYEKIYHQILNAPISESKKVAIQDAMDEIYKEHNRHVQDNSITNKVNYKWLRSFLRSFCSTKNERGFVFTTNQDLFFENLSRYLDRHNGLDSYIPSEQRPTDRFRNGTSCFINALGLPNYDYQNNKIILPTENQFQNEIKDYWNSKIEKLHLVKLHGSWGWKAQENGKSEMVIGINKTDLINKIPLLKYYLEQFKTVLSQFQGKLLVIGYGFNDSHINDAIIHGLKNGLKLHVVDSKRPKEFYESLGDGVRKKIWDGLAGYYPYRLQDLFPPQKSILDAKDKLLLLKKNFDFDCNAF